jgi:hypothetical protein
MKRPYQERLLSENTLLRKFSKRVSQSQLEWHRDRENRIIEVLSGDGWKFQRDNELPETLQEGDRIYVNAGEYHRLLKGSGDLYVKIYKEGKKKKKKKPFPDLTGDGKVTRADILKGRGVELKEGDGVKCPRCGHVNKKGAKKCVACGYEPLPLNEKKKSTKPKPNKYQREKYKAKAGTKRGDTMARLAAKVKAGKKLTKADYAARERDEKKEREKKGYKNIPRSDTQVAETLTRMQLRQLILETLEEEMLDSIPDEDDDRVDLGEDLSAKTKKSLDKKADKRGLTRSSVYAEFRKGLAAYAGSGSRKGMSAHQWAHARVNSANPSKSWAVVKKKKGGKKKKKK